MKFFKKESGQAIVEFAIVLPILLIILCGIIDFGWVFYNMLSLENCTRDGARYATVNAGNSECVLMTETKIRNISTDSLKDNLAISVSFSSPHTPVEGDVTVLVYTKVKLLTPVAGAFFDNQEVQLSYSVTMKAES